MSPFFFQRSQALLRSVIPLLLFAAYPVALLVPVRTGLPLTYEWSLPVFVVASLLALLSFVFLRPGLIGADNASKRVAPARCPAFVARIGIAIALGWTILSAALGAGFDARAVLALTGVFSVPLYCATCERRLLPRSLPLLLACLWGIHAAHGLWQWAVDFEVIGVTGNRNWMAALLAATAPWAFVAARRIPCRIGSRVAPGAVVAITLALLWLADSRATLVALAAYGTWRGITSVPCPRLRRDLAIVVVLALLAGLIVSRESIGRILKDDIRPPCWQATAAMIVDNPIFGIGPGKFRREFPRYRLPAQQTRAVAADITEHPHNEILRLAAETGLPFALAWAVAVTWLILRKPRSPLALVHYTAFVLVVHALFDKPLAQPPTNLLAGLSLGLLARPYLRLRLRTPQQGGTAGLQALAPAGIALAFLLITAARIDLPAGHERRAGRLAERGKRPHVALQAYQRAANIRGDARDYYSAGFVAVNQLNRPETSIELLSKAVKREPWFGHAHLHLGLAYGRLGDHHRAAKHFALETKLYPLDPDPAPKRLLKEALRRTDKTD